MLLDRCSVTYLQCLIADNKILSVVIVSTYLDVFESSEDEAVEGSDVQVGQFQVSNHRQTVESVGVQVTHTGRQENHLHVAQTF